MIILLCLPATLLTLWGARYFFHLTISEQGAIGDSIAGLLAPFIGIVTTYLVYKAFIQQKDTHDLEKQNQDFQLLSDFLESISREKEFIDSTVENLLKSAYAYNKFTNNYGHWSDEQNLFFGYHHMRDQIENLISIFKRIKDINKLKEVWPLSVEQKTMIDWKIEDLITRASIRELKKGFQYRNLSEEELNNLKSGMLLMLHGADTFSYYNLEPKLKQSILDLSLQK